MRAGFLVTVVILAFASVHCGGDDGDANSVVDTSAKDSAVADTAADILGEARVDEVAVDPADIITDQTVDPADVGEFDVVDQEVAAEVVEDPTHVLDEETVADAEPGCEDCYLAIHDGWTGDYDVVYPQQNNYDFQDGDTTIYFTPWMRYRVPHPGTISRILVYTAGAGAISLHLSTGFPGGHYPCLSEDSGADPYMVYKPFVMEVTEEPGWRAFDVSAAAHTMLGYDELFVIFDQLEDARVGLVYPSEVAQGDYKVYGGLIGDPPGDQMQCFPSMSNFTDNYESPLVWLMRAEVLSEQVVDKHIFADQGADGPKVGGHASFGDFDNDGDEDFLSNGSLWANDGSGKFENISEEAQLAGLGGETVWGDYDNDGFRDILGVGGADTLFHNNGDGTFTNVTEEAGLAPMQANNQGVVWVDVDGDGYLDFYAGSYGTLEDGEKATRDYFFYNNGDGTFTDANEAFGLPTTPIYYHGRGVCVSDYDQDGDPDIYVGNYRLDPNQLWNNLGGLDGFEDVAWDAGVKGMFEQGAWGHAIGPGWADLDNDGLFDIVLANLAHPRFYTFSDPTTLHFNNGDGTFTPYESEPFVPPEKGILYDETHSDTTMFDYDNDGDVDIFLTSVYEGRRSQLYANDGTGYFVDTTYEAGIRHFNGWGAGAGDIDNDGDQDLVAHRLFLNQQENGNHYLKVKLVGGATVDGPNGFSNRDAIGAVVTVKIGDKLQVRQVEGGTGVGCQNSSILHFGLGADASVDSVLVDWPSGMQSDLGQTDADQTILIEEAD